MRQHNFDQNQMGSAPLSVQSMDSILQNDTILPAQFFGARRHVNDRVRGELALWRETLHSARRALDARRDSITYKEAVMWFQDVDNDAVASLTWCCDVIGADPVAVSRLELARAARGEKLARTCTSRVERVGSSSASRIGYKTRDRQAETRRRLLIRIAAEQAQS